ncbi:hypothetical protein T4B_6280 [Trichinella pseudospiralis]|uniref:Uncharacterized protein n=1 Tax=Trichinella pseudospiralis TaxID=6337 RepID=A0A0V1I9P0_TRIPS|nr:hypothetical protein T4B_6280 [Trichinella pseudospiralis]
MHGEDMQHDEATINEPITILKPTNYSTILYLIIPTQQKPNAALPLIADGHVGSQMCNVIKMKELKSVINEFCEMEACPEWDLKYLKQVEDGETKNGPHPGA